VIEWLTRQGYTVHVRPSWVTVYQGRGEEMEPVGNYSSVVEAFASLGGPTTSILHNPKGLQP
jgi:hypothetical protein